MYRKLASGVTSDIISRADDNLEVLISGGRSLLIGDCPKQTILAEIECGPQKWTNVSADLKIGSNSESSTPVSSTDALTFKHDIPTIKLTTALTPVDQTKFREQHTQLAHLAPHQRTLLQDTYRNILEKQIMRNGCSVMLKLFSNYPNYKNIWPLFREIPDSSLMSTVQLRKHARIYMGALNFIINSMDDDDKLSEALRKITQAHIRHNVYKHHIMHMLPALLEVIEENGYIDDYIREAWTTLFDVIANLIDMTRASVIAENKH